MGLRPRIISTIILFSYRKGKMVTWRQCFFPQFSSLFFTSIIAKDSSGLMFRLFLAAINFHFSISTFAFFLFQRPTESSYWTRCLLTPSQVNLLRGKRDPESISLNTNTLIFSQFQINPFFSFDLSTTAEIWF